MITFAIRTFSSARLLVIAACACPAILVACAPKPEATMDPWHLQPPTLSLQSARGLKVETKIDRAGLGLLTQKGAASQDPLSISENATLSFAPTDRGLPLVYHTRCTGPLMTDFIGEEVTGETNSMIRFLPRLLLMPHIWGSYAIGKTHTCTFEFTVRNATGSTHKFAVGPIVVSLKDLFDRAKFAEGPLPEFSFSKGDRASVFLICRVWWTEKKLNESTSTTNSSTAKSSMTDVVDSMARDAKVDGDDRRATERRPICATYTVLNGEMRLNSVQYISYLAPRLAMNRTLVLPKGEISDLLLRPLYRFEIQNLESQPATIFFPESMAPAYASILAVYQDTPGPIKKEVWTRGIRVPFTWNVVTPNQTFRTPRGTYVVLAPSQFVTVELKMARPSICVTSTNDPFFGALQMQFPVDGGLAFETIANQPVPPSGEALDNSTRDPNKFKLGVSGAIWFIPPTKGTGRIEWSELPSPKVVESNEPSLCFRDQNSLLSGPLTN